MKDNEFDEVLKATLLGNLRRDTAALEEAIEKTRPQLPHAQSRLPLMISIGIAGAVLATAGLVWWITNGQSNLAGGSATGPLPAVVQVGSIFPHFEPSTAQSAAYKSLGQRAARISFRWESPNDASLTTSLRGIDAAPANLSKYLQIGGAGAELALWIQCEDRQFPVTISMEGSSISTTLTPAIDAARLVKLRIGQDTIDGVITGLSFTVSPRQSEKRHCSFIIRDASIRALNGK